MSDGRRSGWPWTRGQFGPQRESEGAGQDRLADAGNILDQEVPAGEGSSGGGDQRVTGTEHDLFEVAHQGLTEGDGAVDVTQTRVQRAHPRTAFGGIMGSQNMAGNPRLRRRGLPAPHIHKGFTTVVGPRLQGSAAVAWPTSLFSPSAFDSVTSRSTSFLPSSSRFAVTTISVESTSSGHVWRAKRTW